MDNLLGHLDTWLMIITLLTGGYYLLWKDRVQPLLHRLAGLLQAQSAERADDPPPAIMSRSAEAPAPASGPEAVHVLVQSTSTAEAEAGPVPADTDAENADTWELPRVSRALSDRDIIITLAVQRAGGKYRFSANQIHTLAGGPRANVLALVKQVREGPTEYRPLTPEQQQARQALGLDERNLVQ